MSFERNNGTCLAIALLTSACGPSIDAPPAQDLMVSLAGFYSAGLTPLQPAPSHVSRRTIYDLSPNGTGESYTLDCDDNIRNEAEFTWTATTDGNQNIQLEVPTADGSEVAVFWEVPSPCSSDSSWRTLSETGGLGIDIYPGRYCNPTLSGYDDIDKTHICEFEFCGDLPDICAGDPE